MTVRFIIPLNLISCVPNINYEIPKPLLKRLRVKAEMEEVNQQDIVIEALDEKLPELPREKKQNND